MHLDKWIPRLSSIEEQLALRLRAVKIEPSPTFDLESTECRVVASFEGQDEVVSPSNVAEGYSVLALKTIINHEQKRENNPSIQALQCIGFTLTQ